MTNVLLEWQSHRQFPYERAFGYLEAERLFALKPSEHDAGLGIPLHAFEQDRADRLTYFARVLVPGGKPITPRQARLESSATLDGRLRQATRYSSHGIHEYKGKFNPQVVRAIGNMLGLPTGAWVLDPFCGSGTTILECAHSGWNVIGIDRNPLAVRIANAKARALKRAHEIGSVVTTVVESLVERSNGLSSCSAPPPGRIRRRLGDSWTSELPPWDYLCSWFALPVLAQIVLIRRALNSLVRVPADRQVFEVVLSDYLRRVSLQEPADLRIRRRKEPKANYPLVDLFIEALQDRISRTLRARRVIGRVQGRHLAICSDTRTLDFQTLPHFPAGGFDAIITSPPYETALPYIDTDRLSLVLFQDIRPDEIHSTEKGLIGAREIGLRERRDLEASIQNGCRALPMPIVQLCRELLAAASAPGNGFRRTNRPALTLRYFADMAACLRNLKEALRPGGFLALVVGKNRTVLGGKEFEIDTPELLSLVAEHQGYVCVDKRPMDTYPRYDLHRRNSIAEEMLLVLQRAE